MELRVLMVEDSGEDAELVKRHLRTGGYELICQRVETAADMEKALVDHSWDLVVSDFSMPRFSGLAALALLKTRGLDTPFILVSGTIGEATAVQAMKAGAGDYILKDNLARLGPAVRRELQEAEDRAGRRRAEAQLRESEEHLRLALLASHRGTWDWNMVTGEVVWSEAVELMHGLMRGTFGKTYEAYLALIYPDDRTAVIRSMADALERDEDWESEFRVTWPDASVHWISESGHITRDTTGKAVRMLGTAVDVTARREALLALEQSEARKAAIMETALDAIITIDHENRVREFNAAAEQMFGYSRAQVLGKTLATRTIPLMKDEVGDLTGKRMEFTAVRADGTEFPAELTMARIRGTGPASFTVFVRDITSRKRAEAASELHRADMERINQELERKNEKLAELYGNAQRFVDNVSHEFRTPLTVIKGYAEAMAEGMAGPVSTEQREFLGFIIDRTRDLAQMVDDLLDTSKLRAGTLRVDRRPARVEQIISQIRPMLLRTAGANKIQLVEKLEEGLPEIFADAEKIGRVVINLVVNAIKFSREGSKVKLWAKRHCQGGVEIGVSDHGPGIAKEELTVIFERFKQVGDPQRSSTKGFGLGLNIAKEMVALNLGAMNVSSQVGKGSTFSFTLPPNDPAVVLRRHLSYMRKEAAGTTLTALRVGFEPAQPISDEIRGFVASSVSPLDLILEASGSESLMIVSCSTDPADLLQRLRDAGNLLASRFGSGNVAAVHVEEEGSWRYPESQDEAVSRILEELNTEVAHA